GRPRRHSLAECIEDKTWSGASSKGPQPSHSGRILSGGLRCLLDSLRQKRGWTYGTRNGQYSRHVGSSRRQSRRSGQWGRPTEGRIGESQQARIVVPPEN